MGEAIVQSLGTLIHVLIDAFGLDSRRARARAAKKRKSND